jgi:hypothetical protein
MAFLRRSSSLLAFLPDKLLDASRVPLVFSLVNGLSGSATEGLRFDKTPLVSIR